MTDYDPRFRRTKIIATLGPASADEPVIRDMIRAGANIFRINSSHGTREERTRLMDIVRRLREEQRAPIGLLVDLQGPRIRVGSLDEPRELDRDAEVVFVPEGEAVAAEIPTTYRNLANDVHPGATILLDDGLLATEVTEVRGNRVHAVVRFGGLLKSHKGMNLPGVLVSAPAVTDKDKTDIEAALEHGVDLVGVSFVRRAEDLEEVRGLVPPHVRLVGKIEKAAALEDLDRIVDRADALMVARGDLGVELLFEEVPLTQKRLISLAIDHERPVITATQMLESMVRAPRPTRAEASDVANAILDGTDAVMLSAETAIGSYPVKAVEAMARIIHEVERERPEGPTPRRRRSDLPREAIDAASAIAFATTVAAEALRVSVIVCFTKSGFTARKIAVHRGWIPIVALSTESSTFRFLSLVWGVVPILVERVPTYETMLDVARGTLLESKLVRRGEQIVVTAGVPFEVPGTTNLLKVETV
jgi:pyruvate kinase